MRSLLLAILFVVAAAEVHGQAVDALVSPRPRSFTMLAGFGNAMGWFGVQGEKYFSRARYSLFGGLGYTPEMNAGPSGPTVAGGGRIFTSGTKHRGFLEISYSQIAIQEYCFASCRRLYGPGVQVGYQLVTNGGFSLLASIGAGYAGGVVSGESMVHGMMGLGLGYTWRRG